VNSSATTVPISPTKAHLALAELENMGIVRHVITQNIDGLHKKAGAGLSGILEAVKKILRF
jgi:NAD-dependent deacetylase